MLEESPIPDRPDRHLEIESQSGPASLDVLEEERGGVENQALRRALRKGELAMHGASTYLPLWATQQLCDSLCSGETFKARRCGWLRAQFWVQSNAKEPYAQVSSK